MLDPWVRAEGDVSSPRWILAINPDARLEKGSIRSLITALEAEPKAAVAGPALRYSDGRFQHAAFRFPGPRPGLARPGSDRAPKRSSDKWTLPARSLCGRPALPRRRSSLGACMLVRGEAMREVGSLDTLFFMYCEEIDWCQRFSAADWHCICVPGSEVVHHGGASSSQMKAQSFLRLWESRHRYWLKHMSPGRAALLGIRSPARAGKSHLSEISFMHAARTLDREEAMKRRRIRVDVAKTLRVKR